MSTFGSITKAVLILGLLWAQTSPAPAQVRFFVDPVHGDDAQSGHTTEEAFRTIEQARDAVAALDLRVAGPVTVYLRGGRYALEETIVFTSADSGRPGAPVTYRNYPGETPVLSGGRRIPANWQRDADEILKTYIGPNLDFRQLYVDGRKAIRARRPNEGSYAIMAAEMAADGFLIDTNVFDGLTAEAGMEIAIKSKWMHKRLLIDAVRETPEGLLAAIEPVQWQTMRDGPQGSRRYRREQYWLENARVFLDAPGEWYYSAHDGMLYYWPREDDEPEPREVVVPILDTLIALRGELDDPVEHVAFEGLVFQHAGWARPNTHGFIDVQGNTLLPDPDSDHVDPQYRHEQKKARVDAAVSIHSGRHIRIEHCTFEMLGGTGLVFNYGGTDNQIMANRFVDLAATAIEIGNDAYRPDHPAMWPRRYLVFNNEIRHIGTEYFGSLAIKAFYVDSLYILHNDIYDIPYTGIDVGWGWNEDEVVLEARNAVIENNRVERYLTELVDGSAIYSANPVFGSIIRGNYLKGMHSPRPDPAIYNDGAGAYWIIEDNVIDGANRWLGQQSWGVQRKRDILARRNYSTTRAKSIYGVNRRVEDLQVQEDGAWPDAARAIIERAGRTDAPAPSWFVRETDTVIIIDNADEGFSTDAGGWETDMGIMDRQTGYYGSDYAYTGLGSTQEPKWAAWTPDIEESGYYHIYIRYPVVETGAEYAPVEITCQGGARSFNAFAYNQRNPVYHNQWIFLGRFFLESGQGNQVKLYATGAGIALADAVKFVKLTDFRATD